MHTATTDRIILIGMKASGKTSVGRALAARLDVPFIDLDAWLEQAHEAETGERLPFREIYRTHGGDYFRRLERATLAHLAQDSTPPRFVLAVGGGTPLAEANRHALRALGTVVLLDPEPAVLLARIVRDGVPAFFPYPDDPARSLDELLAARRPLYQQAAHLSLPCGSEPPDILAHRILVHLEEAPHAD
jgi:shikimate kinase